jgi:ADP-heptose:LPS heptosyltransferase
LPAQVILSGGPREWGIYPNYFVQCPPGVIGAGCEQNFSVFCGLLYLADVVIGVDSLAIHLALALGKKVVILPGPTPATELEVYGRGVVLTTASPEKVYEEVKNILS